MGSYRGQTDAWGAGARLFRASDIIGAIVVNRDGEAVGTIDDIVLDDDGRTGADIESGTNPSDTDRRASAPEHRG